MKKSTKKQSTKANESPTYFVQSKETSVTFLVVEVREIGCFVGWPPIEEETVRSTHTL